MGFLDLRFRTIFYLEISVRTVILFRFNNKGVVMGDYRYFAAILLTLWSVTTSNAEIIAEYSAAITAHKGDIEALAAELSSEEYEITGIMTMEFNIAEDGTPDVRFIGSSIAYAPFNDALLAEVESWQLQPHSEASVIIYKQFVIKNKPYKPAGTLAADCPIPGSPDYIDGTRKICDGLERTRKSMDYRYNLYLRDYPGSGGFALLLLYTGGDGYVSRVSTKYSDIEDFTFRGELEGWLKANTFPGDLPPNAIIGFPLEFKPKTGYTPDASIGDYQICLMGYKDILQARYRSFLMGEDGPGGAVTVSVEIGPDGKVVLAEVLETDIENAEFAELIPDLIKDWRFPPGMGATVELTFKL